MLFEKFVEQHRVHRFVAHCLGLAFLIPSDQVGIHFFHVLGNESKHNGAIGFNLLFIMEGDRFKRQDGFAGLVHGLDLLLEPARGHKGADFVIGVNVNRSARCDRGVNVFDSGGVALARNSQDPVADTNIATAGGEKIAGIEPQCDVI